MEVITQFLVDITWPRSRQEEDLLQGRSGNILVNIGSSARKDLDIGSGKKEVSSTHFVVEKMNIVTL
jgi:hypothetical protein